MNRLEWIALAWHALLGPAGFHKLISTFGSPEDIREASDEELFDCKARLTDKHVAAIREIPEQLDAIAEQVEALEDEWVRVLCSFDEDYPPPLAALPTAPPVLSMAGDWSAEDEPGVAIVGTRTPTVEGAEMAGALAAEFAGHGITVVSGLARGIDTAAHHGALSAGGRTIAVLGSGIQVIHPRENESMARAIAQQGAVISELSPGARPNVRTLMARNRLQSALSNAVIVVESKERGGTMQTAADARKQDRLLFAVDWETAQETNAGTRKLIRRDAVPISGPEDVAEAVRLMRDHMPGAPETLDPDQPDSQLSLF
jgi:DNA processing protein